MSSIVLERATVGELRLDTSGKTRLLGSPLNSMIHRVETFGEEMGTWIVNGDRSR
jgi:hypothetical protein